jgi:hypothetical protein
MKLSALWDALSLIYSRIFLRMNIDGVLLLSSSFYGNCSHVRNGLAASLLPLRSTIVFILLDLLCSFLVHCRSKYLVYSNQFCREIIP